MEYSGCQDDAYDREDRTGAGMRVDEDGAHWGHDDGQGGAGMRVDAVRDQCYQGDEVESILGDDI